MTTEFTLDYIIENKGCYETGQVKALPFENNKISLQKLFEVLPIKDFCWFLCRKSELTKTQNQLFALSCATFVLPIYEKKHPNDNIVRDCIKATRDYLKGNCSLDVLVLKRCAASAAATYAADSATYAAYGAHATASAYAIYSAADADSAAYATAATAAIYSAGSASAYATYSAADSFKEHVRVFVFENLLDKIS